MVRYRARSVQKKGRPTRVRGMRAGFGLNVHQTDQDVGISFHDDRIIPRQDSSGVGVEDVKIAYVVDCSFGDCNATEQSNYDLIAVLTGGDGRHLKCFPVDINGAPRTSLPYTPVLPNSGHSIDEFADVAWNINSATQTSFVAFDNDGVWRMGSFGEGERWVDPPTNVCSPDDPDAMGACCQLGDCTQTTQADCTGTDAEWKGAGTSCATPGICDGKCFGEGCDDIGACCCTIPATCHNPKLPGDTTCWNGPTQDECEDQGGTFQGPGSQCGGSPGICGGPISGACCLLGGVCIMQPDDVACGLMGGTWLGDPSCSPNPCLGACTNPVPPIGACCTPGGGCGGETSADCCNIFGGNWIGDGTVCADCP